MNEKQLGYAREVIRAGQDMQITPRGIVIGLSVPFVESSWVMFANEGDPESLNFPHEALSEDFNSSGLFQQRPPWWGTAADRMDPYRSARMFFAELDKRNYMSTDHSMGWYAQSVQQSVYFDCYDERMADAQDLYDRLNAEVSVEKVLDYPRDTVTQETYYNCGPATAQNITAARGLRISESDLASDLEALEGNVGWNDEDGTDNISQLTTVLNARLPGANYVTVDMPNDPPSGEQVERLWADIRRSIDAGYGVAANIVAPPSNYPRGVKGSVSPRYAGGTVFHYLAVMGYDLEARAVWIADSGFAPFGYWMSIDQLATLIPPKGYTASAVVITNEKETPVAEPQLDRIERLLVVIFDQLAGPGVGEAVRDGNSAEFKGFTQGGNRSLYNLVAADAAANGVSGTFDILKAGK